ncbi:MAG: hypothetical protein AMXMBFR64_26480 [Myxococcales bacterium]
MTRAVVVALAVAWSGLAHAGAPSRDARVSEALGKLVDQLKPLQRAVNLSWYQASVTGADADFAASEDAQNAVDAFLGDARRFEQVRGFWKDRERLRPETARQVGILYREMLGKQVPAELLQRINKLQGEAEKTFNAYRATVGGKELSQNELKKVLRESKDEGELRAAWEGQKAVGPVVLASLLELVDLRNQVARTLGFRDHYALALEINEQGEKELLALFDELDAVTREPFLALKGEADARLAARLGIEVGALRPWHYQDFFFQEPPQVFDVDYEAIYGGHDVIELSRRFYEGIGLPVDDVLARSDLKEKPGKTPHAFCADIDREEDVRVLANVVDGFDWASTMVHELGHAVYDKFKDRKAPYLLRGPSHWLTTEGFAMMLNKLVLNPHWIEAMVGLDAERRDAMLPAARKMVAFNSLAFARWCLVMLHFERALYADPKQDLSRLWWDLVERYQGMKRPPDRTAPDFASKVHLVVAPVYYHNYMMGELFGAQVHAVIARDVQKVADPFEAVYVGDPKVGAFLKERLFEPGARLSWGELTRAVTGEALSPRAYAEQVSRLAR